MNAIRFAIDAVLLAGGFVLLVPVLVLLVQIVASLRSSRALPGSVSSSPSRVAVLIPAHDESSGLLATLQSVLPQLRPGDRCLVVADNCSDDTALVAATAGADVVERFDDALRGKGYALDFGIRALAADPPSIVIVVDADCIAAAGSLALLANASHATGRPVQALYLITAPLPAGRGTQIAEFAFRIRNWARPLGYLRMGLPCQLMGTGMAFPWPVLRTVDLATGHIVEDMKLGIDLAAAGHPPLFLPDALVTSVFPVNEVGTKSQRTRWEHGHLSMIVQEVPRLFVRALKRRDPQQLALALDLMVPPVALLAMLLSAWLLLSVVAALFGGLPTAAALSACTLTLFFVAMGLGWYGYGRSVISLSSLGLAALYALRKIPLYLRFIVRRQAAWVRSKRDAG